MTEQGAEQSVLEGAVSSLIFQNEENGYTILRLDVGEEEMTVVGSMPGVSPGEYLTVRGQWVRHATYGVQFRADVVERRLPQGMKEIYHYLASGAVKGVGKATARLFVAARMSNQGHLLVPLDSSPILASGSPAPS